MAVPDWLLKSAAPRVAQQAPTQAVPEDVEQSITADVVNTVMGPVSVIGNTLDMPGSSVRDLIGGALTGKGYSGKYNPFDQYATPFASDNRVTFRDDILPDMGWMRKNKETGLQTLNPWSDDFDLGEFGRDLVGFGLDVVTDPLSWINPFGAATKAGKAAKAAGVTDQELVRVFQQMHPEKALKGTGPRYAAMHVTPKDLQASRAVTQDTLRRLRKATGTGPDKKAMPDQPLRRQFGVGFMTNKDAKSFGLPLEWQEKYARAMDKTGAFLSGKMQGNKALQKFPRWLQAAFNPAVMNRTGRSEQQLARAMYNNRKKLVTEQKERINKLRYDIDDIASDIDEQVYQGMKQADPRSTKDSFAGANLDDVVRATDRETANYGFVVGIDDANTYVRFTSPEGSEKVVDFAHDLSGSSPKLNKNIRVHHKAGSAGARKQARQQSTSIVNNLMRYLAEAPETLDKLKPSAAARLVDNALAEHASFLRSSPETVANIRNRLLNTAAEATAVKDSVFEAVRRYGVPSKELTKFADILDPATGQKITDPKIGHFPRYANVEQLDDALRQAEKAVRTSNISQAARRDVLRYIPAHIINRLTGGKLGKELRDGTIKDAADLKATELFKTKKGKKTVGDFLDQDFKRFEEDAADEIVKMKVIDREGVFGPKGKELVGVNAHAYELFNYLKARSGGKVFKNLAIDDLETYVTDLARAGANAKSVFDVLGDQTNWRIPQGFQRITVKALKDGKYEIAGVKGGKDVAISTVDNIDAVRSMIGTENANNLKRSMLKDRDATFVLDENDISKLPQGAPTTEEAYLADRFRQSGGVPLHKALESAGLVTSEADIKFATDNLMAQIRSLDVDPEMANAIATVYQPLTQPEVINQYFKVWDKATQWLKNNLTVPFPSFATRNLGSGQLMNMLASGEVRGVGDMIEYGKSIGRVHKAMADPVKMRELVQELDAHGLLPDERGFSDVEMGFGAADRTSAGFRVPTRAGWGGWRNFLKAFRSVSDDMSNEAADAFAELGKKRLRDRFGIRGTRRALKTLMETGNLNNQVVEFYNRATMYDYLRNKKGWSPYAAAEKVKELQFDYGDITTVDRYAKRGMPFYTFTKKMANAFVKSLAANPGGPMAATITVPARYEKREDKRPRPEYLSKGFAVPLEKAKDGSERYLTGFGLAWEDPMRFMSVDPNNIFQRQTAYELAGSMHPFIKGPAELMTGQSFFMDGRDLTDLDPTAGRLLTNVFGTGKPKEPPVNILGNPMASRLAESVLANSPASRYLTTARQLTDSRRDGLEKAVNFLTGIKTNIVTDKARDAMLRDAATQLLRESGGAVFERPYVNKQVLEQMPEAQRKRALVLSQLLQRLSERAKASKAGEPLPILFDR